MPINSRFPEPLTSKQSASQSRISATHALQFKSRTVLATLVELSSHCVVLRRTKRSARNN